LAFRLIKSLPLKQSLIVTLAVSATISEILTLKAKKSLNFSDRPLFEALVRGNPLEFGDEIWRQKTRVLGLSVGEEIMPLALFVLTQYRRVTDGQTDRQTDGQTDGQTRCDPYYPR